MSIIFDKINFKRNLINDFHGLFPARKAANFGVMGDKLGFRWRASSYGGSLQKSMEGVME